MSIHQWAECLKFLKTCQIAVINMKKGSKEDIGIILESCQEGAIIFGEMVEKMEGEDSETIYQIEEFCELCYEGYVTMEETGTVKEEQVKELREALNEIVAKAEQINQEEE